MFVSHYSQQALTAVTLAFPMQNLLIAVSVGTSVGVNSLLSRKLGAKDITSARKAAGNGLTLSVISWAFFAFIGLFFSKTFVSFFTNDPELITMGTQYISICLIFSLGLFIDIICERILQGTGDTIHPMIIQSTGAIVNILLDPILIFGLFGMPRMGVMGAAIATVFAQHISTVLAIYYVRRNKEIVLKKSSFRLEKQTVKDIYAVGIPTIIMQAIGTILITSLNKILIGFSTSAVAVFGIYFRLQSFIFMPVFGLNTGMIPVIGYNYGARKPKRITATIKVGLVVAITIMGIGTALFMLFPHILLSWFDATPEMIAIGTVAMQRISMGFVFAGVSIVLIALFQGMGYGYLSMINSVSRQLVFLLPAAYLLGKYVGLDALWYSFFISELASFTLTLYFFRKIYKTKIKTMTA
jgi:putative MATE family efflux protein